MGGDGVSERSGWGVGHGACLLAWVGVWGHGRYADLAKGVLAGLVAQKHERGWVGEGM
jgi:hypothetical protein